MVQSNSGGVLRRFVAETLWGNKGVCKVNKVWLGLSFFMVVNVERGVAVDTAEVLMVLLAVTCWSLSGFWINDLADERVDAAAGRPTSAICLLPRPVAIALIILVAAVGVGCVLFYSHSGGALLCYALALVIGYTYSLRPVRFKDRERWGLWAFTLCVVLACVCFPWFWLRPGFLSLAVIFPIVFADEWIKIYGHEVQDYQDDTSALSKTHVVALGIERARSILRIQAHVALTVLVAGVILIGALGGADVIPGIGATLVGAAASAVYGRLARMKNPESSSLVRSLPLSYLGLSYAVSRILPVLLLLQQTLKKPSVGLVLLVACFLIAIETWNWRKLAQPSISSDH